MFKVLLHRLDAPMPLAFAGAAAVALGAYLGDIGPATCLISLAGVNAALVGQALTVFLLLVGVQLPGRAGSLCARLSRRRVDLASRAMVRGASVLLGASAAAVCFAGVSAAALGGGLTGGLLSAALLMVARQLRQYAALRGV